MRVHPEEYEVRKKKLEELEKLGINPYPYHFEPNSNSKELKDNYERLKGKIFRLAGRVMSKRVFGKLIFSHIRDRAGDIQVSFEKTKTKVTKGVSNEETGEIERSSSLLGKERSSSLLGKEGVNFVKKYIDIGDIIGIEGTLFKTKKGEVTIAVEKLTLLAKSLMPLPEKWHGLKDKEKIYRTKYIDYIVSNDSRQSLIERTHLTQLTRKFFIDKGFLEIDTPVLQLVYGGANARPFKTYSNVLDTELFLRISDELYLKRLLVGGLERIFEFSRDFRNEGIDRLHYPEFTVLEAYASYWDYNDMMELVEELLVELVRARTGSNRLRYQGEEITLQQPFKRVDFINSFESFLGINPLSISENKLKSLVEKQGIDIDTPLSRTRLMDKLFDKLIGVKLREPTFVIDHPIDISPLAKRHREKNDRVERFELYLFGTELVNAFSELNNPIDQEERLKNQLRERSKGDMEIPEEIDEDFLLALEYGMPPAGGIGIGIDRLFMFLLDQESIRDVITFPQLKPRQE